MYKHSPTSTREQILSLTSIYHPAWSLKHGQIRGTGVWIRVAGTNETQKHWKHFMRGSKNKTGLFISLRTESLTWKQLILSSWLRKILFSVIMKSGCHDISPCSHEEADTGMCVHARHVVQEGYTVPMIKANDTDVVIIAIATLPSLQELSLQKLWWLWSRITSDMGTNTRHRHYN